MGNKHTAKALTAADTLPSRWQKRFLCRDRRSVGATSHPARRCSPPRLPPSGTSASASAPQPRLSVRHDRIAAAAFAQRNFLNTLRAMFRWALKEGRIPDDPTLGVTRQKVKTAGYKTWSEDHIARFEATHPIGTKARLAFALLLYTGQRRSDVVKLGRQHIHDNLLTIDQGKTDGSEEAHLEIPLHPKLREIIDATPTVGVKTFLVTHLGKPYTAPGFGNWFRELCDQADCGDVSAHGLRKATARRLAEIGCSANQIAAITGHASLSEVQRYTKAADRKRMAREAMAKLIEGGW
jgi:integrase